MVETQVGIHINRAQALDGQQLVVAPGALGRGFRQGRATGDGVGLAVHHIGLADFRGAVGVGRFRRQVAIGVELVALELHAQGLLGEVLDGNAAGEIAVIELQVEAVQHQAGGGAGEVGDQLDLAQAAIGHGGQGLADTVEELHQVQLGNR